MSFIWDSRLHCEEIVIIDRAVLSELSQVWDHVWMPVRLASILKLEIQKTQAACLRYYLAPNFSISRIPWTILFLAQTTVTLTAHTINRHKNWWNQQIAKKFYIFESNTKNTFKWYITCYTIKLNLTSMVSEAIGRFFPDWIAWSRDSKMLKAGNNVRGIS